MNEADASLHESGASLCDAGASPHEAGASLHDAGASPHDAGVSPHDAGASLHDAGASLHGAGVSPHEAGAPLHDAGASPHGAGASPHDAGAFRHDPGASPHNAGGRLRKPAVSLRLCRCTVRKGYAFPILPSYSFEAPPRQIGGGASTNPGDLDGKAEPYRTVRRRSRSAPTCRNLHSIFRVSDPPTRRSETWNQSDANGRSETCPRLPAIKEFKSLMLILAQQRCSTQPHVNERSTSPETPQAFAVTVERFHPNQASRSVVDAAKENVSVNVPYAKNEFN